MTRLRPSCHFPYSFWLVLSSQRPSTVKPVLWGADRTNIIWPRSHIVVPRAVDEMRPQHWICSVSSECLYHRLRWITNISRYKTQWPNFCCCDPVWPESYTRVQSRCFTDFVLRLMFSCRPVTTLVNLKFDIQKCPRQAPVAQFGETKLFSVFNWV